MKKVYSSNEGVIKAFGDGIESRGNNIFADGNILYDYGYHFPMVIRLDNLFIINGDRYSMTTGRHQSICIRNLKPNVQIPFSGLIGMVNDKSTYGGRHSSDNIAKMFIDGEIKVIDWRPDRWEKYTYINKDGEECEGDRHYLGDVLLKYKRSHYLSAFDHQEPMRLNPYFLTQLQGKPLTVDEAYLDMQPDQVKNKPGVVRQGEWFFMPTDKSTRELDKVGRMCTWNDKHQSGSHIATEVRKNGVKYVRGIVRHKPDGRSPQHIALKLDKKWYIPVKNTTKASWQADGLVD